MNELRNKDEIDFLSLFRKIWNGRMRIGWVTLGSFLVGIIFSFLLPKEFTSSSTFIPQTAESGNSMGNLGGLAAIAGINLGMLSSGTDIPPSLYPRIVSSLKFKRALLNARVLPEPYSDSVTYQHYFEKIHREDFLSLFKRYTIGLPGILIDRIKKESERVDVKEIEGLNRISEREYKHFQRMEKQLEILPNRKEGFVTISFTMPEALMAAQMARQAEQLLQQEIIEFKMQNAREQYQFTLQQFLEKKNEFEAIQKRLADFRDKNQNLSSAMAMNELDQLEAEYNFAFSVYNELAKQLEQAKLQVNKDTPIFSVIQDVEVPLIKSAPKRGVIIVLLTLCGFLFIVFFISVESYLIETIRNIRS